MAMLSPTLNEVYQQIDHYGLNTTRVLALVCTTLLIMLFAFREIISWFMKTNKIARQMKSISARLEFIETQLAMVTATMEQETEAVKPPQAQPKKTFEFNH